VVYSVCGKDRESFLVEFSHDRLTFLISRLSSVFGGTLNLRRKKLGFNTAMRMRGFNFFASELRLDIAFFEDQCDLTETA